jgi:hypothetical protein
LVVAGWVKVGRNAPPGFDVAIWDNTEKDILLQPTAPRNGTNSDAVGTIVQYTT